MLTHMFFEVTSKFIDTISLDLIQIILVYLTFVAYNYYICIP